MSWNNRDEDWNSAKGLFKRCFRCRRRPRIRKVSNDKWTIQIMKLRQSVETQVEPLAPGNWFQFKGGKLQPVAKLLETLYLIWA